MGSLRFLVPLLAALLLISPALCANGTQANETANATSKSGGINLGNMSLPNINIPKVNFSDWGDKLKNATSTGEGPIDSVVSFLMEASPFLLLIAGIILLVLSGFGKLVGMLLVGLALIRLFIMLFSG